MMKRTLRICLAGCLAAGCLLMSLAAAQAAPQHAPEVTVVQDGPAIQMENGLSRIRIEVDSAGVRQSVYARERNSWKLVAESFQAERPFPPAGNRLFDSTVTEYRYLVNEILESAEVESANGQQVRVKLTGVNDRLSVVQHITLKRGQPDIHFDVAATLKKAPTQLDYLLSCFTFARAGIPSFVHTPSLKYDDSRAGPGRDQVVGDRSFHAPAIILQEAGLFCALVPDLDAINRYRVTSPDARRVMNVKRNKFSVPEERDKYTMPTALDLNVASGLTARPVLSFGLIDSVVSHHIRYQRVNDESMIRRLDASEVRYEFDLFAGAETPANRGYQQISHYHWQKYGRQVFAQQSHQAMPFESYVRLLQDVTLRPLEVHPAVPGYRDTGSFLFFELDGQQVGGYRNAAPFMVDNLSNSEFWNNVRDAVGMYYWGKKYRDNRLIDMARRTINLALLAPQNEAGMFPLNYRAAEKKWVRNMFSASANQHSHLFTHIDKEGDTYNLVAMSKTAAHLLEYYRQCEQDDHILDFVLSYAEGLLQRVDADGSMPSYVSPETGESYPPLTGSAQSASTMWFLAELYGVKQDPRFLAAAERIGDHLIEHVLPRQLWTDLEQYYSCGNKPFDFRGDSEQGQPARGNLSQFWACEGFASLYRATQEDKYLEAGEQCLDYCAFFQCCWDPHFIYTAFPFGGFAVDNADSATMLDARQAEMVEPFAWYGRTLGRQDLLERAVAAARSSVVLINHPRHKENNLYRHTNIYPFGLGPENIDHEGHPQSAMRTSPSWGEGSGVFTGLAEADRELGGAFVDLANNTSVGVDGLRVDHFELDGATLRLQLVNVLAELSTPWDQPYETELRVLGVDKFEKLTVVINGGEPFDATPQALARFPVSVLPNGAVEIKRRDEAKHASQPAAQDSQADSAPIDFDFVTRLSSLGVLSAAKEIGLDAESVLMPLAKRVDHPYRRYRWSVDYAPDGSLMINALPPEAEMGWTPWERWWNDGQQLRHESWVLYPLKNPTTAGTARWYQLPKPAGLSPVFAESAADLESQLRLARVDVAAKVLNFDFKQVLLEPLSEQGQARYRACRWVVMPHILGNDMPVIYLLPPMNRSDSWPWESWYTDGKVPLIHHVHYTAKTPLTTGLWRIFPGASQRPAEIFGRDWYWYDDTALIPTMAEP